VDRRLPLVLLISSVLTAATAQEPDPVAGEIAKWSSLLASDTRTDKLWLDAKKNGEAALAQAAEELRKGRRLAALERMAAAGQSLGAALYAVERPSDERTHLAAFEAEWTRMGVVLKDVVRADHRTAPISTAGPAFVRALAELSASQARESYAASLEYGRNTEPQYGLYYLGAAQAHRRLLEIAQAWPAARAEKPPALRSLRSEIDALQRELLGAYHPPAAIERHPDFIVASAALKEARELDRSAFRYAALLRYLQAAQRVAMLQPPAILDMRELRQQLDRLAARLAGETDHTIGRFFIERARSALEAPGAANEGAAAAIVSQVLPRYAAALGPAPLPKAAEDPRVTVTLVRWPFT
jgi:hypothetical protein